MESAYKNRVGEMGLRKEKTKGVSYEQSVQKKRELVATTSYLPLSLLAGLEFRMQLDHGYVTYPGIMNLEKKSFGILLRNIYLPKRDMEEKKRVRENSLSCILSA